MVIETGREIEKTATNGVTVCPLPLGEAVTLLVIIALKAVLKVMQIVKVRTVILRV